MLPKSQQKSKISASKKSRKASRNTKATNPGGGEAPPPPGAPPTPLDASSGLPNAKPPPPPGPPPASQARAEARASMLPLLVQVLAMVPPAAATTAHGPSQGTTGHPAGVAHAGVADADAYADADALDKESALAGVLAACGAEGGRGASSTYQLHQMSQCPPRCSNLAQPGRVPVCWRRCQHQLDFWS